MIVKVLLRNKVNVIFFRFFVFFYLKLSSSDNMLNRKYFKLIRYIKDFFLVINKEKTIKTFPTSNLPITVKNLHQNPKFTRISVTIKDAAAIERATQSIFYKAWVGNQRLQRRIWLFNLFASAP